MTAADDIDRLARRGLGIEELRPEQRAAVDAAIEGRDVLAVMPTGSGKSAIYQLVAAAVAGPTVVVSPLIALQHDQIEGLGEDRVGEAVAANSHMSASQRDTALERIARGDAEFLFVAPEQLARESTMETLIGAGPSVFVVDEAHCISSWGHDFRPDYLRLGRVIEALHHPVVIALTATASPPVREEIVERLGLRDAVTIVHGFDRPNIRLAVERASDESDKDQRLLERTAHAAAAGGAGIVYVATRTRTEELAEALADRELDAAAYHAGMTPKAREDVHRRFMEGAVGVVVATTAFGMGIDKPDVRFVIHGDVADSLDSYYQEIGRAGRDGDGAEAVLFYRPEDLALRRYLGARGRLSPGDAGRVVNAVLDGGGTMTVEALEGRLEISPRALTLVLAALEEEAAIEIDRDLVTARADDPSGISELVEAREQRRELVESSRLEMMRNYAETSGCRRRLLLGYFGEHLEHDCGTCDNCESGSTDRADTDGADASYPAGSRVSHEEFGRGEVILVDGDAVTVLFDEVGYKTLSAEISRDRRLLRLLR